MDSFQDIYPLSPMQEGMLFHSIYAPRSGVYIEQRWCVVEGNLDVQAFQAAWNFVINRHPSLRSEFHWEETDRPVQVVYAHVDPEWTLKSLEDAPTDLEAFLAEDRQRGFSLDHAPLMRFSLFQLQPHRHQFIWTFHHLLMDGWCNGLLIKEVLVAYESIKANKQPVFTPATPYRNYIDWLQKRSFTSSDEYWQNILAGHNDPTSLKIGEQKSTSDTHQNREASSDGRMIRTGEKVDYAELETTFDKLLSNRLQTFARTSRLTLNTLIQGAWAVILSRYADTDDVVFGATVSGRPPDLDLEESVGLFINTVPVRVQLSANVETLPWLRQIQSEQRQREQHGFRRLLDLQAFTGVHSGTAMFESLLVFENYPISIDTALESKQTGLKLVERAGFERTNFPLTVVVIPGSQLRVNLRFDLERYSPRAVQRIADQFQVVLSQFLERPDQPISKINVLCEREKAIIEQACIGPNITTAQPQVHLQFHRQAQQHPDKIALSFEAAETTDNPTDRLQEIDYQTLDQQSNGIARRLQQEKIGPGCRIGIHLSRSPQMVACLLGVLKAGAAYVPLDTEYPLSRLRYMITDAEIDLLLHDMDELVLSEFLGSPLATLPRIRFCDFEPCETMRPARIADDELAYIIYTSGSTGQPKGVKITHGNLANFIGAMRDTLQLTNQDKLLAVTTISFDIAALELFLPLTTGAAMVLANAEAARNGKEISQLLDAHKVSWMQATPATWRLLLEAGKNLQPDWRGRLKILCGGESLDGMLAAELKDAGRELWNLYGPTETTIWSGALQLEQKHLETKTCPVGKPIWNTQFAVLDQQRRPMPLGAAGELYIGGDGVGPGYWKKTELTQTRFVEVSEIQTERTSRMYATGDLVCLREDGLFDFLGRLDGQIKLRGFRIEVGEIESIIREHSFVNQVAVVLQQNPTESGPLIAFVILHADDNLSCIDREPQERDQEIDAIRKSLKSRLPGYMIPSQFCVIEDLPLTLNGKVNRKALQTDPKFRTLQPPRKLQEPHRTYKSPHEAVVAAIWSDLLETDALPEDNFFDLGGHSLTAARMISRVRQALAREVDLPTIFNHPHLQDFCRAIEESRETATPLTPIQRLPRNRREQPVASAQRRQWILAELSLGSSLYSIPAAVRITGKLSTTALHRSLAEVIARHHVLATEFHERNGEPYSVLADPLPVDLTVVDFSDVSTDQIEDKLSHHLNSLARKTFDLKRAPLWRAELVQLGNDQHVFVFVLHHILADGWSMGILIRELVAAYSRHSAEESSQSELLSFVAVDHETEGLQYADYAAWQSELDISDDLTYWRRQLKNLPTMLPLPTDFKRSAEQSFNGATLEFKISADDLSALQRLSQRQSTTLFMTLLGAFQLLLYRYSGSKDFSIGTPVANRPTAEVEDLIGLFVNTLAIRSDLRGDPTLEELLTRIRQTTLDAFQHQRAPFERVVEEVEVERSRSTSPLFNVLFTLENAPLKPVTVDHLDWAPLHLDTGTSKFDLSLSLQEQKTGLRGLIEFSTDLFLEETVRGMIRHFIRLLKVLPSSEQQRISSFSILDEEEYALLSSLGTGYQRTAKLESEPSTIHEIFSKQAQATPNAVALIYEETSWTYRELEESSDQLAFQLKQGELSHHNSVQETRIGVAAERSPATIVSLLGILKAGATYVPLDSELPQRRRDWMIEDVGCTLILGTAEQLSEMFPDGKVTEIGISRGRIASIATSGHEKNRSRSDRSNPVRQSDLNVQKISQDALAYILYTSGSTGLPKGVCTPHRAILRLVAPAGTSHPQTDPQLNNAGQPPNPCYLRFAHDEVYLQTAPLGFDASTLEIWGPLLNGGTLVIPTDHDLNLEGIATLTERYGVTTLWLTAALFHAMVDENLDRLQSVRQLIAGGDILSVDHLCRAHAILRNTQLINGYGPTECTTFTCCHSFRHEELVDSDQLVSAPIGQPITDTKIYVLDADMQQVPIGVPGELYVGGSGLARGYHERPDLTAEHFIPNPFFDIQKSLPTDENITLYKTGDRVQYRSDGSLQFLGRSDRQVKLRGYRIELGEIESILEQHPDVKQAVVVLIRDDLDTPRLVAYLSQSGRTEWASVEEKATQLTHAVRDYLLARIPLHQVPAKIQWVDNFQLNANGKVDRQALPKPVWNKDSVGSDPTATEIEAQLIPIWSSLLPSARVGLHDNFFDLGGDSILAMRIVSQAGRIGLKFTPAQLFQHQTVAELSRVIVSTSPPLQLPSELTEPTSTPIPPTPIQSWFLEQRLANPHHFNQSTFWKIPTRLDRKRLEAAIQTVIQHHDSLRLRLSADATRLSYAPNSLPQIQWIEAAPCDAVIAKIHGSLHLNDGPLFQVAVFDNIEKQEQFMLFVAHHFVIDAISWSILLEDLGNAYEQTNDSNKGVLPPKTASYQAWSLRLQESMSLAENDYPFWQETVNKANCVDSQQTTTAPTLETAETRSVALAPQLTEQLLQRHPYEPSAYEIIFTAVALAFQQWTGQDTVVFDLENHGREPDLGGSEVDVSRTIGWFTALYPLVINLADHGTRSEQIARVQRQLKQVPSQGRSYGVLRYGQQRSELITNPSFGFNYLGSMNTGSRLESFQRLRNSGARIAKENRRTHLIDINCWIENGQFQAEWTFDVSTHTSSEIQQLTDSHLKHIERLLEVCRSGEKSFQQNTDLLELNDADLETILKQVRFDDNS